MSCTTTELIKRTEVIDGTLYVCLRNPRIDYWFVKDLEQYCKVNQFNGFRLVMLPKDFEKSTTVYPNWTCRCVDCDYKESSPGCKCFGQHCCYEYTAFMTDKTHGVYLHHGGRLPKDWEWGR